MFVSGCLGGSEDGDGKGSIITYFDYGVYPTDISWKPDGSYALICGQAGSLYRTDGETIEDISHLTDRSTHIESVIWHPIREEALLLSQYGSAIYDGGEVRGIPDLRVQNGEWNPSGEYAILVRSNYAVKYLDEDNFTNVELDLLQDDFFRPSINIALKEVAFKPDGSEALVSDYNGYVFNYANDRLVEISNEITNGTWYYDIQWDPSGSEALLVGRDARCVHYTDGTFTDRSDYFKRFWSIMDEKPSLESAVWDPVNERFLVLSDWRKLVSFKDGKFRDISDQIGTGSGRCRKMVWKPGSETALILIMHQSDLTFEIYTFK